MLTSALPPSSLDFRTRAKGRLPRPIFDFIDGAAGEEHALINNRKAFASLQWVPRTLHACPERSTKVSLWGQEFAAPFGVSPTSGEAHR